MTNSYDDKTSNHSYADNTNLEEISDWITKIIVGLTLINFDKLLSRLDNSAASIALSFGKFQYDLKIFSYCLIIFYSGLGFLIGYYWTRTNFRKILSQTKIEIDDLLKLANSGLNPLSVPALAANTNNIMEKSNFSLTTFLQNKPIKHKDDTQKERWGKLSENNGFMLKARVEKSVLNFFDVYIEIDRIDINVSFSSQVIVFLDSTFYNDVLYLNADENKASVKVVAYEAFTIGALVNQHIELELNLQEQTGFPKEFYYKN